MKQDGFKELKVWQKAKELAVRVYKISDEGKLGRDFGLRDQIRRAAVSVPSNIAEGDERNTNKESVRFFYIAKGSAGEIRTQLEIAFEIGYIGEDVFRELDEEYSRLGKMIGSLIRARGEGQG
jgi:four helix bundle protein